MTYKAFSTWMGRHPEAEAADAAAGLRIGYLQAVAWLARYTWRP